MLLFSLIFAANVNSTQLLRCEDFDWLANRLGRSELFTPSEKIQILTRWINYTDPKCFDRGDAKAD